MELKSWMSWLTKKIRQVSKGSLLIEKMVKNVHWPYSNFCSFKRTCVHDLVNYFKYPSARKASVFLFRIIRDENAKVKHDSVIEGLKINEKWGLVAQYELV